MKSADRSSRQHGIGASVPAIEDDRLVRGKGLFVSDVFIENCLTVVFVRSQHAGGKIQRIDTTEARGMPGVSAVFTAADIPGTGVLGVSPMLSTHRPLPYPILADAYVQAVGQPVAAVVASSPTLANDAAEAVIVDVDAKPIDDEHFLNSDGALETGDQATVFFQRWQCGDVDAAFKDAAWVVQANICHPRLAPCPIEGRSIAVRPNGPSGVTTVWMATQTPHRARSELAKILDLPAQSLHVITGDVGGAFGMKASLYPEEVLTVWAAHKLQQPLRWQASRSEDFLSATHGRGTVARASLAIGSDGQFLALSARINSALGHWLPTSASVPTWNAARILPGPYQIACIDIATRARPYNTAPVGIYRGAGRPEAAALMERLVEAAAHVSGIDNITLRRRNFIKPIDMPYRHATGARLDSGEYERVLNQLLERSDYSRRCASITHRRRRGEVVGLGIACYVEPSGQGWESAKVTLNPDGSVIVATGGSSQGHSRETALTQVIMSVLDVAPGDVTVLSGNTQNCPAGIGALASRSTPIGASAVLEAAKSIRDQLGNSTGRNDLPTCQAPLSAEISFETSGEAWGYGCYLAAVSIDPETGVLTVDELICIDDIGTVINPMLVRAQIVGGIAQGIGEALLEQVVYDESGQLLSGSLMDYALPRADTMPDITLDTHCTPSPFNPLGAKGVGEAGTIGAPAAILNAVHNALEPFGVSNLSIPLTSEKLWRIIRKSDPHIAQDAASRAAGAGQQR